MIFFTMRFIAYDGGPALLLVGAVVGDLEDAALVVVQTAELAF